VVKLLGFARWCCTFFSSLFLFVYSLALRTSEDRPRRDLRVRVRDIIVVIVIIVRIIIVSIVIIVVIVDGGEVGGGRDTNTTTRQRLRFLEWSSC